MLWRSGDRPVDDEVCNACQLVGSGEEIAGCIQAIDYAGLDDCGIQNAQLCCYSQVSGEDCLGNDLFWLFFSCAGPTCDDNRTCDGITPTTPATTPSPAMTTAPAVAAADATVAPVEAGFMTAAPSAAADALTEPPVARDTVTPEPTTAAERAIDTSSAPTTAEEAEDADANSTNGAGPGLSRSSPAGLVLAGLVAVAALVV